MRIRLSTAKAGTPVAARVHRARRRRPDELGVAVALEHLADLVLDEAGGNAFLGQHRVVAEVTPAHPERVHQPRVQRVVLSTLARQLSHPQRVERARHALDRLVERQPLAREERLQPVGPRAAVAAIHVRSRHAVGRILRVQVERQPVDPSAEPALQPRRPREGDVAEGSYVVRPDADARTVDADIVASALPAA
jgi:hypothetical protein